MAMLRSMARITLTFWLCAVLVFTVSVSCDENDGDSEDAPVAPVAPARPSHFRIPVSTSGSFDADFDARLNKAMESRLPRSPSEEDESKEDSDAEAPAEAPSEESESEEDADAEAPAEAPIAKVEAPTPAVRTASVEEPSPTPTITTGTTHAELSEKYGTPVRADFFQLDPKSALALGDEMKMEEQGPSCPKPTEHCKDRWALPPSSSGGERYTAAETKPTLVIAWCDEFLEWIPEMGCEVANFVIYSKCNRTGTDRVRDSSKHTPKYLRGKPILPVEVLGMPCVTLHDQNSEHGKLAPGEKSTRYRRGHHASYLTYMIDYYGKYPAHVWFTKGTLRGFRDGARFTRFFKRHSADKDISFMSFGAKIFGTYTPSKKWQQSPMSAFTCGKAPKSYTGIARACFMTSGDRMMRYPKCYYEHLLQHYFKYMKMGRSGGDAAWAIERFYNVMFHCEPKPGQCGATGDKCHGQLFCMKDNVNPERSGMDRSGTRKAPKVKTKSGETKAKVSKSGRWGYIDKNTFMGQWRSTMAILWKASPNFM